MSLSEIATDLCSACGICCNGVMFHKVGLQPGDSLPELKSLGLHVKRRRRGEFSLQPCPAHQEAHCTIYEKRPCRCRLFECRQLRQVASGVITEAMALEKITEVLALVAQVNALLLAEGKCDLKKPLSKRYEQITAEPLDPGADSEMIERRGLLAGAMQELEALLENDFRV